MLNQLRIGHLRQYLWLFILTGGLLPVSSPSQQQPAGSPNNYPTEKTEASLALRQSEANRALAAAISAGDLKAAEAAIQRGANVNGSAHPYFYYPMLQVATTPRAIKFLLDHGANINALDAEGRTVLYNKSLESFDVELIRFLLSCGASPYLKGKDQRPLLEELRERVRNLPDGERKEILSQIEMLLIVGVPRSCTLPDNQTASAPPTPVANEPTPGSIAPSPARSPASRPRTVASAKSAPTIRAPVPPHPAPAPNRRELEAAVPRLSRAAYERMGRTIDPISPEKAGWVETKVKVTFAFPAALWFDGGVLAEVVDHRGEISYRGDRIRLRNYNAKAIRYQCATFSGRLPSGQEITLPLPAEFLPADKKLTEVELTIRYWRGR